MSRKAKQEYLEAMCQRYHAASGKAEKTRLLDEVCRVCGYHRKYVVRRFRQRSQGSAVRNSVVTKKRSVGRPKTYTDPLIVHCLEILLKATNLVCSKRLKAVIPIWLPFFSTSFKLSLPASVEQQLLQMSPATIDRLLRPTRRAWTKCGLSTTKPGSLIKKHIPIRTNQWDEQIPGFLEADTVAHCGSSMEGQFVYSLNTTDIATAWTETRALWGKGERGAFEAIEEIERALPFPLRGFDADNGSEFMNWHLYKYLTGRRRPVAYTRQKEWRVHPIPQLPEKRQRAHRGKELDADPSVPRLPTLRRSEDRSAAERSVPHRVDTVVELLHPLLQTDRQGPGRLHHHPYGS